MSQNNDQQQIVLNRIDQNSDDLQQIHNENFNVGRLSYRPRRSSILKLNEAQTIAFVEQRRNSRRVSWAQTFQYKEVLSDGTAVLTSQEMNKYGPIIDKRLSIKNNDNNQLKIENPIDQENVKLSAQAAIAATTSDPKTEEAKVDINDDNDIENDENIRKVKNKLGIKHLPQVLSKYYDPKKNLKDYATIINTALNKYGVDIDNMIDETAKNPTENNLDKLFEQFKREYPNHEENFTTFLKHFNLDNQINDNNENKVDSKKPNCIDNSSTPNIAKIKPCHVLNSTKITDLNKSILSYSTSITEQSPIRKEIDDNDLEFHSNNMESSEEIILKTVHDTTFMQLDSNEPSSSSDVENDKHEFVKKMKFNDCNNEKVADNFETNDMSLELSSTSESSSGNKCSLNASPIKQQQQQTPATVEIQKTDANKFLNSLFSSDDDNDHNGNEEVNGGKNEKFEIFIEKDNNYSISNIMPNRKESPKSEALNFFKKLDNTPNTDFSISIDSDDEDDMPNNNKDNVQNDVDVESKHNSTKLVTDCHDANDFLENLQSSIESNDSNIENMSMDKTNTKNPLENSKGNDLDNDKKINEFSIFIETNDIEIKKQETVNDNKNDQSMDLSLSSSKTSMEIEKSIDGHKIDDEKLCELPRKHSQQDRTILSSGECFHPTNTNRIHGKQTESYITNDDPTMKFEQSAVNAKNLAENFTFSTMINLPSITNDNLSKTNNNDNNLKSFTLATSSSMIENDDNVSLFRNGSKSIDMIDLTTKETTGTIESCQNDTISMEKFDIKPRESYIPDIPSINLSDDDDDNFIEKIDNQIMNIDDSKNNTLMKSLFTANMDFSAITHDNNNSDNDGSVSPDKSLSLDNVKIDIIEITKEHKSINIQDDDNNDKQGYEPTMPINLGKSATEIIEYDKQQQQVNNDEVNENLLEKLEDNRSKPENYEQKMNDDDTFRPSSNIIESNSVKNINENEKNDNDNNLSEIENLKLPNLEMLRPSLKPFDVIHNHDDQKQPQLQKISVSKIAEIRNELSKIPIRSTLNVPASTSKLPNNNKNDNGNHFENFHYKQGQSSVFLSSRKSRNLLPTTTTTNMKSSSSMNATTIVPLSSFKISLNKKQENLPATNDDLNDSMTRFFETSTIAKKSLGLTLREKLLNKINEQQQQSQQQDKQRPQEQPTQMESINENDQQKKCENIETIVPDDSDGKIDDIVNDDEEMNEIINDSLHEKDNDEPDDNDVIDNSNDQPPRILSPIEMEQSLIKMLSIDIDDGDEQIIDPIDKNINDNDGHDYNVDDDDDLNVNNLTEITQNFSTMLHDVSRIIQYQDDTDNVNDMFLKNIEYSLYNPLENDDDYNNEKLSIKKKMNETLTANILKKCQQQNDGNKISKTMLKFLNNLITNYKHFHLRIHSIDDDLLIVHYLMSTVELRIKFGSKINTKKLFNINENVNNNDDGDREIIAVDLVLICDNQRQTTTKPLYDNDKYLLKKHYQNNIEQYKRLLSLSQNYILTNFDEKRMHINKTYNTTRKLLPLLEELNLIVTPAKKMFTELSFILLQELSYLLPDNNDDKIGISVEILGVLLNSTITIHYFFDHLKYPDEAIHPIIIVSDRHSHLYPLDQFTAALKMIKPCQYNYLTKLINGSKLFIHCIQQVMIQWKKSRRFLLLSSNSNHNGDEGGGVINTEGA